MIGPITALRRRVRRFLRREDGSSTIEFVIIMPVFLMLFFSSFESGLLMLRHAMLERAVDMTVRGLRLGTWTPPTHDELKAEICNIAGLIPSCMTTLHLELRPVSTETWEPLGTAATCVDRTATIAPVVTIEAGAINDMMLVRACAIFDPMMPTYGLGTVLPRDKSGGYALIASSAFVNEP